ncbi:hypothetical protein BDZ97DRAFT_2080959 [Flammula alnicola]|nr:hypothetical protein BDZ97DRAFT_2080959 [Flammula alnicola]
MGAHTVRLCTLLALSPVLQHLSSAPPPIPSSLALSFTLQPLPMARSFILQPPLPAAPFSFPPLLPSSYDHRRPLA